jgi:hypothetical protein
MNAKKVRKKVRMLTLVLTTLVLLSLALPGAGTGVIGMEHGARQELQTVTARAQGSTGDDVPLAGEGEWAQASVEISGAPDDAVVSSVRVKYHVVDAEPSGLDVQLLTSGSEVSHALWNKASAEGTVLTQSTDEITTFQGAPVNGTWSLAVQGGDPEGYIDDFSVVVYYETEMSVLQVDGPPGTPAILQLPEGAAPATLAPDGDEKPWPACGEGSSVAPQHVPPGATIIKEENFEGAFPNSGWVLADQSSDGYTRYWDDASCDPCGGDWAAWPAAGGPDGINPCAGHDYPNNMEAWMVYGPFDLSDATDAGTEFVMWREIEPDYDYVFFGVSHDGTSFTGLVWDGAAGCTLHNIGYSDWLGDPSVWVAWMFYSDGSVTYAGPWVDDIVIWKIGDDGGPTIKVDTPSPEMRVPKNRTFTVDVVIEDADDLGAFEFQLTYNNTCVQATDATLGPFLGSTGRSVADVGPTIGTGIVTYGAYSWGAGAGPNGDGVIATVTFQAGANECCSSLHLQNVTVTDTAGSAQSASTEDGRVCVVQGCPDSNCPEDINCDGVINIVDIQLVASKYGRSCPTRP